MYTLNKIQERKGKEKNIVDQFLDKLIQIVWRPIECTSILENVESGKLNNYSLIKIIKAEQVFLITCLN